LPLALVFPVVWTALEWLLAHQGRLAFSWMTLGTSLTGFPLLVQVADLVGARGVTFLLAVANCAIAAAWMQRHAPRRVVRRLALVGAGCLAAVCYGVSRERSLEWRSVGRVAVVRTQVEPRGTASPAGDLGVSAIIRSSLAARELHPNLIVWPESAFRGAPYYHPERSSDAGLLARQTGAYLIAGGIDAVPKGREVEQFNAAFVFDPLGRRLSRPYRKRRLVPLFEWGNGVSAGDAPMIVATIHGRIGILICNEVTGEALAREYRRGGADALVDLSNDGWFAVGAGPAQHAALAVMRAIETRTGVARAANMGISAIIDPLGRTWPLRSVDPDVIVGPLTSIAGVPPYVRLGDWVGLASVILAGCFAAGPQGRREQSHCGCPSGKGSPA
jgi:apolipoprotein N-acyltransferase